MKFKLSFPGIVILALLTGCGETTRQPRVSAPSAFVAPQTVVVADFEGGSLQPGAKGEVWGHALAALLAADLRAADNLRIVDRNHLAAVLREQQISISALADPTTQLRVGRLAGAQYFIFGTYTLIDDTATLVARMANVESGQIVTSESIRGTVGDMQVLSRQLCIAFLRNFNTRLGSSPNASNSPSADAVRYFSAGRDYEARGMYDKAVDSYIQALSADPSYQAARDRLEKASEMTVR